jgi:hypothetical protein
LKKALLLRGHQIKIFEHQALKNGLFPGFFEIPAWRLLITTGFFGIQCPQTHTQGLFIYKDLILLIILLPQK